MAFHIKVPAIPHLTNRPVYDSVIQTQGLLAMLARPLSKPQIIALAACHTCCARRGEPCTFSRCDDPNLLRTVAKQSHLARIKLARQIHAEEKRHDPLDNIQLIL